MLVGMITHQSALSLVHKVLIFSGAYYQVFCTECNIGDVITRRELMGWEKCDFDFGKVKLLMMECPFSATI